MPITLSFLLALHGMPLVKRMGQGPWRKCEHEPRNIAEKRPPYGEDYQIGCILLEQPFFFEEKDWIPAPADWKQPIVQGKGYDTMTGLGKKLWDDVQLRLQARKDLWEEARLS